MSETRSFDRAAFGGRIREQRERLKLTQSEVSDRTGIGISSLSEIEHGKREPTLSQVKKLADCFHTTVADIVSAEQRVPAVVRWRLRPVEGAEAAEARFIQLCQQYYHLERWALEEQPVQLTRARAFPKGLRDAEALARRARSELNLGDRPGLVLRKKLEDDCGIKVFHARVEPRGAAACTWHPDFGPAILLNALNSPARRTFDLAHELFHLLTWGLLQGQSADEETDERLANQFASALLMPEDALRDAVERRLHDNRISIANLCELARDFRVSIEALLWRVHRVYGWTDSEQTEQQIANARQRISVYRELTPDRDAEVPELPERYRALAIQALRSGEISTGRFAEYMGLKRWQAMGYAEQAGGDEEVALPPS